MQAFIGITRFDDQTRPVFIAAPKLTLRKYAVVD